MWKTLRILGIAVAAIGATLGVLSMTEVVAIEPVVILLLALVTLIILTLDLSQRRKRGQANGFRG